MMTTRIKLQFKADPMLLESVRALTGQYLSGLGLLQERVQEVVLAVDEACANSIRHAYDNISTEEIALSFRDNDAFLEVEVSDEGKPMPKSTKQYGKRKEEQVTSDSVRPGGLGLKLMHRVFDDVQITTGEKRGNRVRMRLNLK